MLASVASGLTGFAASTTSVPESAPGRRRSDGLSTLWRGLWVTLLLALACTPASAALSSRAGGAAYYDSVLNITWVTDANLAMTSGYDADGKMTWAAAQSWIASLNAQNGGLGYLGVNNWRLPTVTDTGPPGCDASNSGTDCGYNVALNTGEMARMFYSTLGNTGYFNTSGVATGCSGPSLCLTNTNPFSNLQPFFYWTGTENVFNTSGAWTFRFNYGDQVPQPKTQEFYTWAVAPGDPLASTAIGISTNDPANGVTDIASSTFDGSLTPCTGGSPSYCSFFGGNPPAVRNLTVTPNPTLVVNAVPGGITPVPASGSFLNLALTSGNTSATLTGGTIAFPSGTLLTVSAAIGGTPTVFTLNTSGYVLNAAPQVAAVNGSGVAEFLVNLSPAIAADFSTLSSVIQSCTGPLCALGSVLTLDSVRYRLLLDFDPSFTTFTASFIGQTANNSLVSITLNSVGAVTDTVPDAFGFTTQTGVALNTLITSGAATITGINAPTAISVSGGAYSIGCTATYTTSPGTISNGEQVCVRHTSSSANSTSVVTTLTVGGVNGSFTSTTEAVDTTPNAFSFTDQSNVPLSSLRTSAAVTITGIAGPAPVSVSGGSYSIDCTGTYTSSPGTISNNQPVCVQHTSSANYSTAVNTTLTVGGVSDTFTSSTLAAPDTTPDSFSFTMQTLVPLSSVRTSSPATITGINAAAPVTVSGGGATYSIGCTGTYTASPGTISNSQTVCVRHTSSASYSTMVSSTLNVGGVQATFRSVTAPPGYSPATVTATSSAGSPGVGSSFTVTLRGTGLVNVGGATVAMTYDSSKVAFVPNTPAGNLPPSGPLGTGTGSFVIINGSNPTFVNILPGAPPVNGTADVAVLTFNAIAPGNANIVFSDDGGNASGWFDNDTADVVPVSYTQAPVTVSAVVDTTPDPFSFTDVTGAALSTIQTSNAVTITGITGPAPISVGGGSYSIGCTASFTAGSGTISNNQTVCLRHTSSASNGVAVNTTLTVGGVSDTFTSTTATDTTPDAFGFPDQIQQPLNTLVTSGTVTISGINGPAAIAVTGGQYSIGCTATFTTAASTITNGQTVCVRHTTASTNGGRVNTQLTVGGVTGLFFTTALLADPVVVPDTPPAPTPAVDPPVILFNKTQPATQATIQDIGIETDGLVTGGTAVIGFCTAVDPRDTEGPGNSFKPRPLPLSELSASCSSLVGETLVIPAYMRPIPDAGGVRRFVISTASSTAEFEGALVSQGYGQDIVTYAGGVRPPCNVPLSSRPLWLWGERVGEDVDGVLTDENQVMKPVAAQCNASRSVTKKASNFVQNVSLDESVYSSASYAAGQNTDLDKVLDKLDADDNSCSVALQSVTAAMKTQAAICRTATVFAIVTRDTSVPEVRLTRTTYQYAMKVKLRNYGGPVTAAQAVIRSGVPTTTVVGGAVTKVFGAIPAGVGGGYAETAELGFTIQQDRLLPVDPGVVLPAVSFTPDLTGGNSTRYSAAIAGCEQVARLAKQNRPAFDSCPVAVKAKKYRGALIGGGLGAAFTIYDRLARPTSGGTWSIYPLPTDIIEPAQIPPGP